MNGITLKTVKGSISLVLIIRTSTWEFGSDHIVQQHMPSYIKLFSKTNQETHRNIKIYLDHFHKQIAINNEGGPLVFYQSEHYIR